MKFEKSHQGTEYHSGYNQDTPLFAHPLYYKNQRCSSDCNPIETPRSNVLEPEITVIRVGDTQHSAVRYQKYTHERSQSRRLTPDNPTEGVAGQRGKK